MSGLKSALAEIAAGPRGPRVAAFFDFDGTLIAGYSATVFAIDQLRRLQVRPDQVADLARARLDVALRRRDEADLVRAAIRTFEGTAVRDLEELGERLFESSIAGNVHPEARLLVQAHQQMGHTVVIATSATRFQAGPLARDLGVEHLLATELGARRGILTGEVRGELLWGPGKAAAVRRFATRRRLDLARSHAYANGSEDIQFLELAGHPHPVNPAPLLLGHARRRRWSVLHFRTRRALDAELVARNLLTLTGMGAATVAGLAMGLINRDRRQAINLVTSLAPDVALPLAGVRVDVEGEHHLWARRPAVFIFNHQSYLDGLVIGHLVRSDFTAVAKKELLALPGFAQFGQLSGFAFVDRANSAQAREAMQPVVDKLRQGVSLVIAPEGTRSPTQTLGRFKKGAFHVAMQAEVPIVPIVLRNTGDLLWKRSLVVRPGTVQAKVFPPIDVRAWREEELDQRVAEVRAIYESTLQEWTSAELRSAAGNGDRASRYGSGSSPASRPSPRPARARSGSRGRARPTP